MNALPVNKQRTRCDHGERPARSALKLTRYLVVVTVFAKHQLPHVFHKNDDLSHPHLLLACGTAMTSSPGIANALKIAPRAVLRWGLLHVLIPNIFTHKIDQSRP